MELRHEKKHPLSQSDLPALRQRLRLAARPDPHAPQGFYQVRSLYLEDPRDQALREKLDGVSRREKFRLRYYNGDLTFLRLEKKCKDGDLGWKISQPLTLEEARALLAGDTGWMRASGKPLLEELYFRWHCQMLRPKTLVEYRREPFVFPAGNVRVTLDSRLRTSPFWRSFLQPDSPTLPAGGPFALMEVKWDGFLPDVIRDAVQLEGRQAAAFSKYARCRLYE